MSLIDQAADRLTKALSRLEGSVDGLFSREGDPATRRKQVDALIADRARMAEELDASLERERELQALADEASSALGSAIEEVRAALVRKDGGVANGES